MTQTRRVICSGIGLVTPLGIGTKKAWQSLLASSCGITKLKQEHMYDGCQSKVAAYVDEDELQQTLKSDYHSYLAKNSRQLSRATIFSMIAAQQALNDAKLLDENNRIIIDKFKLRTGVSVGQGMVDFHDIYENAFQLYEHEGHKVSAKKISPYFMTKVLMNMSSGNISIRYNLMGPNTCPSTACATGGHSIGEAFALIRSKKADIMICGSTEASINKLGIAGFDRLRALSSKFNDEPSKSSRPFDSDRCGFVMGEGSGILVLEELEHAKARGLNPSDIYAEIIGFASTSDGYHLTSPRPNGDGAKRCMREALLDANITIEKVSHINAHATSTPMGDEIELAAVSDLICSDEQNKCVSVTSCKGAIGHLLGGAGSVETIFGVLSAKEATIPPTLNLENPLELTDSIKKNIKLVSKVTSWNGNSRILLKNSFGFGGTNACLVISNYE